MPVSDFKDIMDPFYPTSVNKRKIALKWEARMAARFALAQKKGHRKPTLLPFKPQSLPQSNTSESIQTDHQTVCDKMDTAR